jgi:hypothetical protein
MGIKREDPGSVSALVVGLVVSFIACAGLAVDGGRVVSARIRVADNAENAARVGAQAVTNIRTGVPKVDGPSATKLARKFLDKVAVTGDVHANQFEVCVVVREWVEMSLLSLVGVEGRVMSAERCARPIGEHSP